MARFQFEITHPEHDTIKIAADDGVFIDDWHELSKLTCLIPSGGGFDKQATETTFTTNKITAFVLKGDPFGSDTQGEATFELVESGCSNYGWTWRRL